MGLNKFGDWRAAEPVWVAWRLPGLVTLLVLAAAVFGDDGRQWLAFDRSAIGNRFEIWRFLSAHFVHLGGGHCLLNIAGLTLAWYLVSGFIDESGWWFVMIASIAAIDLGFWFLDPQLSWYAGLSGVLHGLLAAGTLAGLRSRRPEICLLAAAVVAKIAYEQVAGPLPGSEAASGGPVVVNAHAYGAVGGLLAAAVVVIRVRRQASI